ncbi:branched-chain-amino-acid aminotransferase-like protein 2 [Phtheirospermum japonicum]|uniref:Branched-chain-amino-acid aminotransferase-like protein 2 n=1 Tax=Phtheirospermum japonicum TaxID=374723 RepID=A0A830BYI7_9LAMI|nr:branched-chain-amino-acid aminotransferase-like protein 2 [Phtheirospermum japonicum]
MYTMHQGAQCMLHPVSTLIFPVLNTIVIKIDGRIVGDGRVGPVTRRLQNAYKELTTGSGVETTSEIVPNVLSLIETIAKVIDNRLRSMVVSQESAINMTYGVVAYGGQIQTH